MTEHEDLIAEALEAHVPREVFFGYPVEPGEVVEEGYIETCMCGEKYPCDAVRLVKALEKITAERDALSSLREQMSLRLRYVEGKREKAEAERDALAAVVEQVREFAASEKRPHVDAALVLPILNTAPHAALDRVKAEAWEEGIETALNHAIRNADGITLRLEHLDGRPWSNPYRKGESNE